MCQLKYIGADMLKRADEKSPSRTTGGVRHRKCADAGYAKGQETRLRIILSAIDLFGEEGYERASTRRIAVAAGVNLPALQYYFSGKMGLYLACA
jgi:AcrR family transcriptional regulator